MTEELDYQPSAFFITEYARPKLACPRCQDGVAQAALPARPIEKGRPGPGLLAQVVTGKYADHLPLYRQEQIFARHAVVISRRTLAVRVSAIVITRIGIVISLITRAAERGRTAAGSGVGRLGQDPPWGRLIDP